jgi:hypothetical protein
LLFTTAMTTRLSIPQNCCVFNQQSAIAIQ